MRVCIVVGREGVVKMFYGTKCYIKYTYFHREESLCEWLHLRTKSRCGSWNSSMQWPARPMFGLSRSRNWHTSSTPVQCLFSLYPPFPSAMHMLAWWCTLILVHSWAPSLKSRVSSIFPSMGSFGAVQEQHLYWRSFRSFMSVPDWALDLWAGTCIGGPKYWNCDHAAGKQILTCIVRCHHSVESALTGQALVVCADKLALYATIQPLTVMFKFYPLQLVFHFVFMPQLQSISSVVWARGRAFIFCPLCRTLKMLKCLEMLRWLYVKA